MNYYLVTVGTMYVQGFKLDPTTREPMYVKLNPQAGFARLITSRDVALTVAAHINGSVIALAENEREEI